MGCSGECCFSVMYVEWYGVCNFVVFLLLRCSLTMVLCICFHICFDWCVVYGVGV